MAVSADGQNKGHSMRVADARLLQQKSGHCARTRDGCKACSGRGQQQHACGWKKKPSRDDTTERRQEKARRGKTRTCSRGVGWQGSAQNNRGETEESVANNRDTLVLLVGDESAEMEGLEGTDQGATLCEVPSSLVAEERR